MINVCFEPKSFAVEIDTDNGKERVGNGPWGIVICETSANMVVGFWLLGDENMYRFWDN